MLVRLNALMTAVALLNSCALAQGVDLPDPQIANIAYTAGKLDITATKQALERSENKAVKAFAADMVGDHEALNKQAIALVKKLRVTPKDNDTSRMLSRNATVRTKELSKLKGVAFDRAYVDNEIIYHKMVDDTAGKPFHSVGYQCGVEEPAEGGPQEHSKSRAARRASGDRVKLMRWVDRSSAATHTNDATDLSE